MTAFGLIARIHHFWQPWCDKAEIRRRILVASNAIESINNDCMFIINEMINLINIHYLLS